MPGPRVRKRKRAGNRTFRQAAWVWLVALDNMLRCPPHGGPGLEKWQVPERWWEVKGEAELDWPCLVGSADCGPDGWTAQNFMEDPIIEEG